MGAYTHNNPIFLFLILHGNFLYMGDNDKLILFFLIFQCWFLYMGAYTHNNLIFLFLILHGNLLYMGAHPTCSSCEFEIVIFVLREKVLVAKLRA
jgi:hypothetical protein